MTENSNKQIVLLGNVSPADKKHQWGMVVSRGGVLSNTGCRTV